MNKFIIIIPTYNAVKYIEKCLTSITSQKYSNYELCVMDDCSTDGSWQKTGEVCNRDWSHFNMCRNETRIASPLANIVKGIELFALDKDDIICIVDGDDSLAYDTVLNDLSEVYNDPSIYMTYGQFVPLSGRYGAYCTKIECPQCQRKKHEWRASHLKTFKRKLWDKIADKDLRDTNGDYYKFIGDAAIMYPMIEMCGLKHMKFIEKVNYLYNDLNPLNEMSVNVKEQLRLSDEIWAKPCYKEIDSL